MKHKLLMQFKDVDKGVLYNDFKKYSAIFIYDTLDNQNFEYVNSILNKLKVKAVEITLDATDIQLYKKALSQKYVPIYYWYIYRVNKIDKNIIVDTNIKVIKNRRKVKNLLTDQVHELAKRMPSMFDKNGEEKGWYKSGKNCIAYMQDKTIISVLTWQYEPQNNNIHIYLTYTLPDKRSMGYSSKLFDYIKKYAAEHGVDTITVCTDVTKQNRTPNMFIKNNFKYFKTGFEKFIEK